MSDIDPAALVEITSEVVSAYLAQNHVPPAEIPALIASVHGTFAGLGSAPEPAAAPEKPTPAVSVRKSVTDEYLISLEDGKRYQALKRHLTKLGLTPAEYRAKWGCRRTTRWWRRPSRGSAASSRRPWGSAPCAGRVGDAYRGHSTPSVGPISSTAPASAMRQCVHRGGSIVAWSSRSETFDLSSI